MSSTTSPIHVPEGGEKLVPGQPGTTAVLVALFGIALPALTYMLLAGLWLLLVFAGDPYAGRR